MTLLWLTLAFGELSVLAFGGANAVLPQMHELAVNHFHWVTGGEFSAMFGLAQAAPGPNVMIVALIGWHTAGVAGVLAVSVGKFVPSSLIAYLVANRVEHFADRPWLARIQRGLVPVSAGLVGASAGVIASATSVDVELALITLLVAAINTARRVHPLWLLGGGAVIGAASAGLGLIPG